MHIIEARILNMAHYDKKSRQCMLSVVVSYCQYSHIFCYQFSTSIIMMFVCSAEEKKRKQLNRKHILVYICCVVVVGKVECMHVFIFCRAISYHAMGAADIYSCFSHSFFILISVFILDVEAISPMHI